MALVGLNTRLFCWAGMDFGLHRALSFRLSLPLLSSTLVPYEAASSQVNSTVWDFDYCAFTPHWLTTNKNARWVTGSVKGHTQLSKSVHCLSFVPQRGEESSMKYSRHWRHTVRECFIQAWRMERMKMRASKSFGHWAERKENTPSAPRYDKWIFPFAVGSRKTRAGWVLYRKRWTVSWLPSSFFLRVTLCERRFNVPLMNNASQHEQAKAWKSDKNTIWYYAGLLLNILISSYRMCAASPPKK